MKQFVKLVGLMLACNSASAADWSGIYIGGQAGYGDGGFVNGGIFSDAAGATYGGHVGYNHDLGNVVIGAELDYSVGNVDFAISPGVGFTQFAHLKGRFGYDMGEILLYGVGGLAFSEVDVGPSMLSDMGYSIGLGADYKIADSWTVGAEYLYDYYDNFDGSGLDVEMHLMQARVAFHF